MPTDRPKIFLSYTRQDLDTAKNLQDLKEQGCDVWRDQESVYGGQNWPKAIGEAVVATMLCCWSGRNMRANLICGIRVEHSHCFEKNHYPLPP